MTDPDAGLLVDSMITSTNSWGTSHACKSTDEIPSMGQSHMPKEMSREG